MKRTLLIYMTFIAGTWLSGFYGSWWAPAGFIVLTAALMKLSPRIALVAGALSLGLVYLGMAWWMNTQDASGLIEKTGAMMGGLTPGAMIAVTTVIGVITGLLSGWLGSSLYGLLSKGQSAGKS